jgi:4-amino-4-deoxy-L-arabinose transferase-like glycosyltransferase
VAFLIDGPVMDAVSPLRGSDIADSLNGTVRRPGTGHFQIPAILLMVLLGALFSCRLLRAGGWALLAFALSAAAANILKVICHRPRPWVDKPLPEAWTGYLYDSGFQSFPSAETATTFAIAASASAFYPRLRLPLYVIAVLVGAARVLVNRHYLSDVAAGAVVGLAVAHFCLHYASRRGSLASAGRSDDTRFTPAARRALPLAVVVLAAAVVLLTGLGALPLFGRDESLYAEAAREMLAAGDWITPRVNGVHFFEKPPLYYWMAGITYALAGVSPFAARLPSALLGILTAVAVYLVAARVWGRRVGLLSGLALVTCLQIAFIGRMGIMDVPLTALLTLALIAYAAWRRRGGYAAPVAFGALVGSAVLLKGFAGFIAPAVAMLHGLLYRRGEGRVSARTTLLAFVIFFVVAAPWFVAMGLQHGEGYASKLFLREHLTRMIRPMQGHGGPVFYYVALIFVSFFPWVVFLPPALTRREDDEEKSFWRSLCVVWIAAVLISFSLVSTKLPGYVTPLFPAMAILVGIELDRRLTTESGRGSWIGLVAGAVLLGTAFALLPMFGRSLAEREQIDTVGDVWRLVVPVSFCAGGYAIIAVAGVVGLAGRARRALGCAIAGQAVVLAAVLGGILPVLSPYLGGAPATLAEVAQREIPESEIVLYETYPEAVAFVLRRPVRTFSRHQQADLLSELRQRPVALIAPVKQKEFWQALPYRRDLRNGAHVLLDVPAMEPEGNAADVHGE